MDGDAWAELMNTDITMISVSVVFEGGARATIIDISYVGCGGTCDQVVCW